MKVSDLIELLSAFPPNLKVVVETDGGAEDVNSIYQALICDNHASQPPILSGFTRRDTLLHTQYRLSRGRTFEMGIESAIVLDF